MRLLKAPGLVEQQSTSAAAAAAAAKATVIYASGWNLDPAEDHACHASAPTRDLRPTASQPACAYLALRASCHCSSEGRLSQADGGPVGGSPATSMDTERRLGLLSYSSSSVLAACFGECSTSAASSSAVRDGEDGSG
jgi:hypothetical protein